MQGDSLGSMVEAMALCVSFRDVDSGSLTGTGMPARGFSPEIGRVKVIAPYRGAGSLGGTSPVAASDGGRRRLTNAMCEVEPLPRPFRAGFDGDAGSHG